MEFLVFATTCRIIKLDIMYFSMEVQIKLILYLYRSTAMLEYIQMIQSAMLEYLQMIQFAMLEYIQMIQSSMLEYIQMIQFAMLEYIQMIQSRC